ncbi:MAG: RNA polymerase sigma factor [Paracoccaceae bacterium]|nr:RNA polymerase sigma factor [Paracoccaceae bacterium]
MSKKTGRAAVAGFLPAFYPRLWRFCYGLTGSRSGTDDLAQSTCERAPLNADKLQPGSDLDRWTFVVARRIWLNEVRATKVRLGAGHVDAQDATIRDSAAPVETNILALEVVDKVRTLPDGQRLAVMLAYVEGYSYRETAEMLDIPVGTVMSRLAAARKALAVLGQDAKVDE